MAGVDQFSSAVCCQLLTSDGGGVKKAERWVIVHQVDMKKSICITGDQRCRRDAARKYDLVAGFMFSGIDEVMSIPVMWGTEQGSHCQRVVCSCLHCTNLPHQVHHCLSKSAI